MKHALALALIATSLLAGAGQAQEFGAGREYSVDLGLGVIAGPPYPGSDEAEGRPWLIWRNAGFGPRGLGSPQGFAISPSFTTIGPRDSGDYADLAGMEDIDRAYELGLRVSYGSGPVSAYGTLRKGFEGHSGLAGEIGAKYRTDLSDRITLWSGVEFGYGDSDYMNTYFGVSEGEAAPGRPAYSPGGGFSSAAVKFEARYALTEQTALLGEVEYAKLIGDAGDSVVVQERYQPSMRVGIVRKFSFGF